jgi:hypothetical protein
MNTITNRFFTSCAPWAGVLCHKVESQITLSHHKQKLVLMTGIAVAALLSRVGALPAFVFSTCRVTVMGCAGQLGAHAALSLFKVKGHLSNVPATESSVFKSCIVSPCVEEIVFRSLCQRGLEWGLSRTLPNVPVLNLPYRALSLPSLAAIGITSAFFGLAQHRYAGRSKGSALFRACTFFGSEVCNPFGWKASLLSHSLNNLLEAGGESIGVLSQKIQQTLKPLSIRVQKCVAPLKGVYQQLNERRQVIFLSFGVALTAFLSRQGFLPAFVYTTSKVTTIVFLLKGFVQLDAIAHPSALFRFFKERTPSKDGLVSQRKTGPVFYRNVFSLKEELLRSGVQWILQYLFLKIVPFTRISLWGVSLSGLVAMNIASAFFALSQRQGAHSGDSPYYLGAVSLLSYSPLFYFHGVKASLLSRFIYNLLDEIKEGVLKEIF